jgi:hypothetical protein
LAGELEALLRHVTETTVNIFDESDALLSHKYQLVYAVGTPENHNEVELRVDIVHSVLCMLNSHSNVNLETILNDPSVVARGPIALCDAEFPEGTFQPLYFVQQNDHERAAGASVSGFSQSFRCAVFDAILVQPSTSL